MVSKKKNIKPTAQAFSIDSVVNMATIYKGSGIVHLRDDIKEVRDIVVGDELLGWNGEFRKVVSVHKPIYPLPRMMRCGIGFAVEGKYSSNASYIEVGEGTRVAYRDMYPYYDCIAKPKKARDLDIFFDCIETCIQDKFGARYSPGDLLKLVKKRSDDLIPYMIGIEGKCLVVNNMIVMGCDAKKITKFKTKEKQIYEERIQREARKTTNEAERLREDIEQFDSNVSEYFF